MDAPLVVAGASVMRAVAVVNKSKETLNVLIFGSGAREHVIADSILKSPLLNKLYLADANDGFAHLGEKISYIDYEDLAQKGVKFGLDLVIIGPEEPLCNGIVDVFNKYKIPCIGVNKRFSQLESSKLFGKKFMDTYNINTASYDFVTENTKVSTLYSIFDKYKFPLVIKANGLCKGKGVKVVYDKDIAMTTIVQYLNGKFGDSSKTILVEEYLEGEEISLMSLWDGKTLLHFPVSRDFKKLDDSVDAPNTGGMGAFCPVDLTNEQTEKLEVYRQQLQNALITEQADFTGFIYSGLIWSRKYNNWYVLEYNVRLGDPETQAILTHLESDFLEILKYAVDNNLRNWIVENPQNKNTLTPNPSPLKVEGKILQFKDNYSACLVIASEGYPQKPKDGEKISIPNDCHCETMVIDSDKKFPPKQSIQIYYAGIELKNGDFYSKGGRILSLCTNAPNPFPILKEFADEIEMNNKFYRLDIDIK